LYKRAFLSTSTGLRSPPENWIFLSRTRNGRGSLDLFI
jgi:hypothetical protein